MSRNVALDAQAIFCRRRHQPRRPPHAKRLRLLGIKSTPSSRT